MGESSTDQKAEQNDDFDNFFKPKEKKLMAAIFLSLLEWPTIDHTRVAELMGHTNVKSAGNACTYLRKRIVGGGAPRSPGKATAKPGARRGPKSKTAKSNETPTGSKRKANSTDDEEGNVDIPVKKARSTVKNEADEDDEIDAALAEVRTNPSNHINIPVKDVKAKSVAEKIYHILQSLQLSISFELRFKLVMAHNPNATLTEKDMRNLALTWQCFIGGEPAIDYTKFANLAGYTEGSARTTLGYLRKKIKNLITESDLPEAGRSDPKTPSTSSGGGRGSSGGSGKKRSRKSAAAAVGGDEGMGGGDGEDEATPSKKKKTTQPRAPRGGARKSAKEKEAEARRAAEEVGDDDAEEIAIGGLGEGDEIGGEGKEGDVVKEEFEDGGIIF
ncbi:MAG: hypothetical protein Q9165_001825 [Trypethelium subeluteriae]